MIGPFGGPMLIFIMLENGFYGETYITGELGVKELTPLLKVANQIVALVYWIILMLPLIVFFVKKLSFNKKFKITLFCVLVLVAIIFIPKIILFLRR